MTNDIKELLTLAAKACGYEVDDYPNTAGVYIKNPNLAPPAVSWWVPHLNDGDGARMEGTLPIDVFWLKDCVSTQVIGHPVCEEYYHNHSNDRQAARRWASLRAAAQAGRQMP